MSAPIEPGLYHELFADAVDSNTKGTIPTHAVPFEANTLDQLRHASCLTPGGAAALRLTWQHRRQLLPS